MKKTSFLALITFLFILCGTSFAEVRIQFDTSAWTNGERSAMVGVAYKMAYDMGENSPPRKEGDELVFPNLTDASKTNIQNNLYPTIKQVIADSERARLAEIKRVADLRASIKTKLQGIGFTNEEIRFIVIGND